ncbi:MAG: methionyl-tRNA formyltransferase [Betaproteobacteria bacterium]|nr:methionyl-tRNA formyltransferase [Betaproteobacteria bacterium]
MRVAFAGTPEFAAQALAAILGAKHEVVLVLTQPDRPRGRGMKTAVSAVKAVAAAHGLPLAQPLTLKDPAALEPLRAAAPDVMVVAAYGLILPAACLAIPALGCLNIHASLLPRWRGAAPIQRALLAGDRETGISIMQMDEGLDTGDVLLARALPIGPSDTAHSLHDKLAALGGQLVVEALAGLEEGALPPHPQDPAGATYAAKLSKAEGAVDWRQDAAQIARAVRAFNPFPVAHARIGDEWLRLWAASPVSGRGEPGVILRADRAGIVVACGEGALTLEVLQKPGGKPLAAGDFLAGHPLAAGGRFDV